MRHIVHALQLALARLGMTLFALLSPRRSRLYRFDIWLLAWLHRRQRLGGDLPKVPAGATRDLLFCFVDHFEPGTKGASPKQSAARFEAWTQGYPELARRFRDSDGRHPQHSFFFPPHYFSDAHMRGLAAMDWQGVGEVELHLHHQDDTSESLRELLEKTLAEYELYGVFLSQGERVERHYGFIHGNWALDNSRPEYCGVNDELRILAATGCYGDFTFPSLYDSQPRMVNCLYRAVDDPDAPKSYDIGRPLAAGVAPADDEFMMITGPIGLRGRKGFPFFGVEDADVTGEGPGTPERVRNWVRAGIHVDGRPEWIFVKVHTHGAPERHFDALLGEAAKMMYATLCDEYADGERFRLHFVSAREMYNVARAAEDGLAGDAGQYRDYEIAPYLTRSLRSTGLLRVRAFVPAASDRRLPTADIELPRQEAESSVEFRDGLLRCVRGRVKSIRIEPDGGGGGRDGRVELETAGGEVELFLLPGTRVTEVGGAALTPERGGGESVAWLHFRCKADAPKTLVLTVHASPDSDAGSAPGSGTILEGRA